MSGRQIHHQDAPSRSFNKGTLAIVAVCIGVVAFYFLFRESLNLSSIVLILLLLACPAMHLFMHRGHGRH